MVPLGADGTKFAGGAAGEAAGICGPPLYGLALLGHAGIAQAASSLLGPTTSARPGAHMQRDAGPSKGTKRPAAPAGLLAIVEAFETAMRSAPIGQGGGGVQASSMPEEEKASAKSGRQTHSPAPAPPVLLPGQAATAAQLTSVVEVDITRIANLRAKARRDFEAREGVKLSFMPFC